MHPVIFFTPYPIIELAITYTPLQPHEFLMSPSLTIKPIILIHSSLLALLLLTMHYPAHAEQGHSPTSQHKQPHHKQMQHGGGHHGGHRSEEHTSELQSRGLISYAVFCLKKKKITTKKKKQNTKNKL